MIDSHDDLLEATSEQRKTLPVDSNIGLPASDEEDPVAWLQMTVNSTPSHQQTVERCFDKFGALSITLADGEDSPIFEPLPGETPLWPSLMISGLFELPCEPNKQAKKLKTLIRNMSRELGDIEIVSSIFEDEEWVRTCLQDFVPINVGYGLWIVPSWHEPPAEATTSLKLDPGLAFGTGTHPTTFLCLEWLAKNTDRIDTSTKVIDYGCGSGILGIGAALLGASNILATDIDGQALLATQMNAEKNKVESAIQLIKPQELHKDPSHTASFDLVLANILAEPLLSLAPQLASLVKQGGAICLSGLLERHEAGIIKAYTPFFTDFETQSLDGWSRVTAVRKDFL